VLLVVVVGVAVNNLIDLRRSLHVARWHFLSPASIDCQLAAIQVNVACQLSLPVASC